MEASVLAQLTALLEQFVEEYELKLACEEGEVLVQAHYVIMILSQPLVRMQSVCGPSLRRTGATY